MDEYPEKISYRQVGRNKGHSRARGGTANTGIQPVKPKVSGPRVKSKVQLNVIYT